MSKQGGISMTEELLLKLSYGIEMPDGFFLFTCNSESPFASLCYWGEKTQFLIDHGFRYSEERVLIDTYPFPIVESASISMIESFQQWLRRVTGELPL